VPKIIKVGRHLTKFWQKQFCTVVWGHGVYDAQRRQCRSDAEQNL